MPKKDEESWLPFKFNQIDIIDLISTPDGITALLLVLLTLAIIVSILKGSISGQTITIGLIYLLFTAAIMWGPIVYYHFYENKRPVTLKIAAMGKIEKVNLPKLMISDLKGKDWNLLKVDVFVKNLRNEDYYLTADFSNISHLIDRLSILQKNLEENNNLKTKIICQNNIKTVVVDCPKNIDVFSGGRNNEEEG